MVEVFLTFAHALATLSLAPFAIFLGVLAAAGHLRRARAGGNGAVATPTGFLVLIPAHNEEQHIGATVKSARAMDWPADRLDVVVMADNCTDGTAAAAREAGATVLERRHDQLRGKGYALQDAFAGILADPRWQDRTAILVVDADSWCDRHLLKALDQELSSGAEAVQCYDAVRNRDDSWRTRLLAYAFALFNGSYQVGLTRLGLGAHLRGNGMCFARQLLVRLPWQASGLAEDLEFSWRLRLNGVRTRFAATAAVHAEMPAAERASRSQRARWEHGRRAVRRLYGRSIIPARVPALTRAAWMLDLMMPPLSMVGLVTAAGVAGNLLLRPFPVYAALAWASAAGLGLYLISPFTVMGMPWRYATALAAAPYYAFWRLTVMVRRAPSAWIRTARERPADRHD